MPTPDGREWMTTASIRDLIVTRVNLAFADETWWQELPVAQKLKLRDEVLTALANTGYRLEFKMVRLFERFKDRILDGSLTDIVEIREQLYAMYSMGVLAMFDEEGNYIGPVTRSVSVDAVLE